jgi:hypothetical protein
METVRVPKMLCLELRTIEKVHKLLDSGVSQITEQFREYKSSHVNELNRSPKSDAACDTS